MVLGWQECKVGGGAFRPLGDLLNAELQEGMAHLWHELHFGPLLVCDTPALCKHTSTRWDKLETYEVSKLVYDTPGICLKIMRQKIGEWGASKQMNMVRLKRCVSIWKN